MISNYWASCINMILGKEAPEPAYKQLETFKEMKEFYVIIYEER